MCIVGAQNFPGARASGPWMAEKGSFDIMKSLLPERLSLVQTLSPATEGCADKGWMKISIGPKKDV